MRVRRLLTALIVVAASTLVVSPAAAAQAGYEPRFESAPCPTEFPVPVPFPQNARCGFLVVPENRSRPEGRTIRLGVAIVPAVSPQPAPDPIVHLTGGPGGIAFFEAPLVIDAGFNRDRDLILMNQRGTFLSEPALTCDAIDRFNRLQVALPLDARSTRRRHVAATRKCRRQLVARGIDIAAYNTTENAADFADLRRALGYDRWNMFGVSYGTDLALTILRDHPEGLRSVILDSTVPPSVVALSGFWPNARDGFQNIFRACTAQARCRSSFPNLERTFTRLVRRLESDPVRTTVPDPVSDQPTPVALDGGALANWLVSTTLTTPPLKNIPSWIAELAAGDPQTIAASRLATVTPPGLTGYGLVYGVICREWAPFDSEREVLAQGRDVLPRYPRSVLSQPPQFTYMFDDCRVWDVPAAPASFREPTVSEIPTLILSGSFDSITPLAWAYAAAETLPNSRIASIPGVGHFVAIGSPCAQAAIASFLQRPDGPDTNCVATLRPPTFVTP